LIVLAGSPDYLAYADYVTTANGPSYSRGSLRVVTTNGTERTLGGTPGLASPLTPTGFHYSLVGPMLTAAATSDPTEVQWWDLATTLSGTATLPAGAVWQGSSPDGWVVRDAGEVTISDISTTGVVTSLGQPIAAEAAGSGSITATTGPGGVLTYGNDDGALAYQQWSAPGTVIPLNAGQPLTATNVQCRSMSGSTAGCVEGVHATSGYREVAVPLTGAPARTVRGCGAGVVVVGNRLVDACGSPPRARFVTTAGTTASAAMTVLVTGGVGAFGKYVTTGPKQQVISALRTAHSTPTTVVTIAVPKPSTLAEIDAASLRAAASAVETEALTSGALTTAPTTTRPAQVLLASASALITAARAADPSLKPKRTTAVMGAVPYQLSHPTKRHPRHHRITRTRSLQLFSHAIADHGARGFGLHRLHGGAHPAAYQHPDGVYVDPTLPVLTAPTISQVALRTALGKLGQPYVWAAAGPSTFDCSGLTQWAYAHAGIGLAHYTGYQWNEGRKIPGRDILPGDLILFEYSIGGHEVIHHVAMYLGAGWMLNAPYTGQYVDVVPVPSGVAGIVRP
jgi:cell wall-associated NlpC family hydrolase